MLGGGSVWGRRALTAALADWSMLRNIRFSLLSPSSLADPGDLPQAAGLCAGCAVGGCCGDELV